MSLNSIRSLGPNTRRLEEIARTLFRYGLADWLGDILPTVIGRRLESVDGEPLVGRSTPERLRLAISELGTTFIKVGQILSTRADLVGPEVANELSRLQYATAPDPPEVVREMIESELGGRPEMLFASFESLPLASASVAQVHAATLGDGTPVVVKVQHAGVADQIRVDLEILSYLAGLAEKHSSALRIYRPRVLIAQFRRQLLHELDFDREARNLERFRRDFAGDETVAFPKPYAELSAHRVLTMERVVGRSVREVQTLKEHGVAVEATAKRGVELYLSMIFKRGFYHADPHPGNVWLRDDGAIVLLDAGMVGRLEERRREQVAELLAAATDRDPAAVADAVVRIGKPPSSLDRESLELAAANFIDDYAAEPIETWSFSAVSGDLLTIIRRHRIHLPAEVALLLRTLIVLEGTARLLHPAFSLGEVLKPQGRRLLGYKLAPRHFGRRLRRTLREWDRLAETLPRDLSDIAHRLRMGTFDVHLQHRRLDTTANRLIYGVLSAALIIAASLLWSSGTPPSFRGMSVLGTACGVAAAFLTIRLLRSVKRSGGLYKDKE